jgi:hypothetical protein
MADCFAWVLLRIIRLLAMESRAEIQSRQVTETLRTQEPPRGRASRPNQKLLQCQLFGADKTTIWHEGVWQSIEQIGNCLEYSDRR